LRTFFLGFVILAVHIVMLVTVNGMFWIIYLLVFVQHSTFISGIKSQYFDTALSGERAEKMAVELSKQ